MKSGRAGNGSPWSAGNMALKSVFAPLPDWTDDGSMLRIGGDALRHLTVARLEIGESIEVFDGKGAVWTARVESIGRKEILARVIAARVVAPDPLAPILAMALIRPAAF